MKTCIVWFRNDLRVSDHPALLAACHDADNVIPVFIFNDTIFAGQHSSHNRNRFLLQCLSDLKISLQQKNADLIIRHGDTFQELLKIVHETKATSVYFTADYTPYARKRDTNIKNSLQQYDIHYQEFPGRLSIDSIESVKTGSGNPYKVFTPFWKKWQKIHRRRIAVVPMTVPYQSNIQSLPLADFINKNLSSNLSPDALEGGETKARQQFFDFLATSIDSYHETSNNMGVDGTSKMSPYLHFGCMSPREIETLLPDGIGVGAWHRQLAWREFYHYIQFYFPDNAHLEFQEKYRSIVWDTNTTYFDAWKNGKTGYPIVDAAMRQLTQEGWMHNRGRLIVGSFLTKDLWLNWRLGESYFMKMLIDGDQSNNNGNWQWIASVGVDPAPVYRRLYNPTSQQRKFDPDGRYVRKYIPELRHVPDKYLSEPWMMSIQQQHQSQCLIGRDYPSPIIDHSMARERALAEYRAASVPKQ
ncbi:MAG: deoxyribodipyrimidine photo-lyase [Candidatus Saccharimonadales bacterium]